MDIKLEVMGNALKKTNALINAKSVKITSVRDVNMDIFYEITNA